jgi:hypothetical protein
VVLTKTDVDIDTIFPKPPEHKSRAPTFHKRRCLDYCVLSLTAAPAVPPLHTHLLGHGHSFLCGLSTAS